MMNKDLTNLLIFLCVLFLSMFVVFATTYEYIDGVHVYQIGDAGEVTLVKDSNENVHIIWKDLLLGYLVYGKFDSSGNTLIEEKIIYDTVGDSELPQAAIDSNDNLHLVWTQDDIDNYEIHYMKLDNSGNELVCKRLTRTNSPLDNGYAVIDVDSSDNVHITYSATGDPEPVFGAINYVKLDNSGNILVRKNIIPDNSGFSRMAIDSNDNIQMISLWIEGNFTFQQTEINYTRLDNNGNIVAGPSFITTGLNHTSRIIITDYLDIDVDNNNDAHIVWIDNRTGTEFSVWYTKVNPSGHALVYPRRFTPINDSFSDPRIVVEDDQNITILVNSLSSVSGVYKIRLSNDGWLIEPMIRLTNETQNIALIPRTGMAGSGGQSGYGTCSACVSGLSAGIDAACNVSDGCIPSVDVEQNTFFTVISHLICESTEGCGNVTATLDPILKSNDDEKKSNDDENYFTSLINKFLGR